MDLQVNLSKYVRVYVSVCAHEHVLSCSIVSDSLEPYGL